MAGKPKDGNGPAPAPELFVSRKKSIAPWLTGTWILLLLLSLAGLVTAWLRGDVAGLGFSLLFLIFILLFSLFFYIYLRKKRKWYLEVEDERLAEQEGRGAPYRLDVCCACLRPLPAGSAPCFICGRPTCPDCAAGDVEDDSSVVCCPSCFEAGTPCREAMLELDVEFDREKEEIEREWKEAAVRLASGGGSSEEQLRRMRGFDADFGERYRERIIAMEVALEEKKKSFMEMWRAVALAGVEARTRTPAKRPGGGKAPDAEE